MSWIFENVLPKSVRLMKVLIVKTSIMIFLWGKHFETNVHLTHVFTVQRLVMVLEQWKIYFCGPQNIFDLLRCSTFVGV